VSKKVIFVSWVKLTDRYMRDYFLDHLINNGVEVEFWDIVALTREQHSEFGEIDVGFLKVVQSIRDLENLVKLKENKDSTYVMLLSLQWKTRSVYRMLSKNGCKVVGLRWGELPEISQSFWKRAVKKLLAEPLTFLRRTFEVLGLASYKKIGLIKPHDIIFTAGSVLRNSAQFSKKNIQLNLPDYDNYIQAKRLSEPVIHGKYAVFLDLNLPYNSDLALEGLKTVEPQNYYRSLNKFFERIEKQYDVKIVIAGHPKTNTNLDVFDSRKVYRLATAELVKDSEFVISHHSTSHSYAVFNFKPCVFIYTNEMEELYLNCRVKAIKTFASYLDASIYNIDKLGEPENIYIRQPNRLRYDEFKYSFATSKETENLSSNDIFLKEIITN